MSIIPITLDPTGIGIEILKGIPNVVSKVKNWYSYNLPAGQVLGDYLNNKFKLKVYVKDLFVPNNTFESPKLHSQEGQYSQINPNINKVWPDVEGFATAELFNLLGSLGKTNNINIVEMSKGYGEWENNMIVLGAQAVKSREFYEIMNNVAYGVNDHYIYDNRTKKSIEMNNQVYGYGIILKAKNPYNNNKAAFLLGGYGTLGTKASVYYFINNIALLGKDFNNKNFGIIVKARIASGEQSTTRILKYDKYFKE